MTTKIDLRRPNMKDLNDWEEACHYLSQQPKKCGRWFPNGYLVHSKDPAIQAMRQWMKENDFELLFYSSGWGWRLRKNWEQKIEQMRNNLIEKEEG